jgi:hypothetical protein
VAAVSTARSWSVIAASGVPLTDTFEALAPLGPAGEAAVARARAAQEHLFAGAHPPNEVFFLFVIQLTGRTLLLALDDPGALAGSLSLGMSAADLQVIALAEHGDPLALRALAGLGSDIGRRDEIPGQVQTDAR